MTPLQDEATTESATPPRRRDSRRRERPARPSPRGRLWGDREFGKLWCAQSVASLGEQVSLLALPLVAITLVHADAFEVGLLAAFGTLPFLLLGLPAGVLLERVRLRPVLIGAGLGRAAVFALPTAAYLLLHTVPFALLAGAALAAGSMSVLFDIGYQAYTPSMVGAADLHEANAKMQATFSGSRLVGPGLAGALVGAVAAPFALLADTAGYIASAASLALIRRPEPPRQPSGPKGSAFSAIGEGIRFVAGQPLLRSIAACTAMLNFVGAALLTELVIFEVRDLHLGAGAVGTVFLVGNLGLIPGVILMRPLAHRFGIGPTIAVSAAVGGLAPLAFPFATGSVAIAVVAAGWFVRALASPVYNSNQLSLRLGITEPALQARMTATMKFVVMGIMPLGSLFAGSLGATLGPRPTLWVIAAVGVATAAVALGSSLRSLDVTPADLSGMVAAA